MTDKSTNCIHDPANINSGNVDQVLRIDSEKIFNEELKTDALTKITEPVSIANTGNVDITSIPDAQWFDEYAKKLLAMSSPVVWEHHKSEIENVNKIINTILGLVIGVSSATIILVAVCIFFEKDIGATISAITGGFLDTVLSVMAGLFNSTLKSKKSYFDAASDSSNFDKMLLLVQTISDTNKKDDVIAAVVRKHFNISDK